MEHDRSVNQLSKLAIVFESSAYLETLQRPKRVSSIAPMGLMGRQVAGKEFLDALLHHGTWNELVAIVEQQRDANSLIELCKRHPSSRHRKRRLRTVELANFHASFFPEPLAPRLHLPSPLDARFAWARQRCGPSTFAMSGVTHTLCTAEAVRLLLQLVTAPFEPFDALICTSQAVIDMVRRVTGTYADYLRDRHGGDPAVRPQLVKIPLGVDTQRYRVATQDQRERERAVLGVGNDEIVVLFVGRLSHHAKAHPFPMIRALQMATKETGKVVHLVLAGWAANAAVSNAFVEAAKQFAPDVRVHLVDGTDPDRRFAVWQAADIFTSLADNIQETFGLVIVEAMASGLPVVATDWDGYRDLLVESETGFLIPTYMIKDATADVTSKLLMGELNYDHFLAQCSQTVTVDVGVAAKAYERLILDAPLRRHLGERGRQRVLDQFAWPIVIAQYEQLWLQQDAERVAWAAKATSRQQTKLRPSAYPPPECSFQGYPTQWLDGSDFVQATPQASQLLTQINAMPLTHYESQCRVDDLVLIKAALQAASTEPIEIAAIEKVLRRATDRQQPIRATVAWMLKYDLLRRVR